MKDDKSLLTPGELARSGLIPFKISERQIRRLCVLGFIKSTAIPGISRKVSKYLIPRAEVKKLVAKMKRGVA